MNMEGGELARRAEEEAKRCPSSFFYILIGHMGAEEGGGGAYLHDNEEVEDQNEGGQKGPGDLVAGQEAPVQVVPADPVGADDQNHHRRQGDEHRPAPEDEDGEDAGGSGARMRKEEESINDGRRIKIGGENQLRRGAVTDIKTHKTLKAKNFQISN